MVGHGGSSASSYLADPTSPIPSHCASIVVTSTLRVNLIHVHIICIACISVDGTSGNLDDADTSTCDPYTTFAYDEVLEVSFGQSRTFGEIVVQYNGKISFFFISLLGCIELPVAVEDHSAKTTTMHQAITMLSTSKKMFYLQVITTC